VRIINIRTALDVFRLLSSCGYIYRPFIKSSNRRTETYKCLYALCLKYINFSLELFHGPVWLGLVVFIEGVIARLVNRRSNHDE
jgi:hypothetical protein